MAQITITAAEGQQVKVSVLTPTKHVRNIPGAPAVMDALGQVVAPAVPDRTDEFETVELTGVMTFASETRSFEVPKGTRLVIEDNAQ